MAEPWTDDDDAVLEAAYREGRTDREIAALLLPDRTPNAIRRRRQARGLTAEVQVVDREQLRALHAEGLQTRTIAERMGCTYRTAQQLLWEEGLTSNTPRGRRA